MTTVNTILDSSHCMIKLKDIALNVNNDRWMNLTNTLIICNKMEPIIIPKQPAEFPSPEQVPEIKSPVDPEDPIIPLEDPEIIPDEDPFENPPPFEIPEPGEGP